MNECEARLVTAIESQRIPYNVTIELTYRCNAHCRHCYVVPPKGKEKNELSTYDLLCLLDDLAEAGCLFLTYTGGELMLREDFWELVQAAVDRHFALQLFTNGTLMDEEAAWRLAGYNVLAVGISLHGASQRTHECITGLPGSYERSLGAIRWLRDAGVNVLIKHVVMQQNRGEYPAILKLADAYGAIPQIDPIVVPANDGSARPVLCRLCNSDLAEVLGDELVNPEIDFSDSEDAPALCSAGHNTCNINPLGVVTPCVQLPIKAGNVRQKRFSAIWRDSPQMEAIRSVRTEDLISCRGCDVRAYCHRCPGLALLEDGDLFGPSRVACLQAEIFSKLYSARSTSREYR
jgi:radical SAM protein with 4Fe4S-binding SPASM domain